MMMIIIIIIIITIIIIIGQRVSELHPPGQPPTNRQPATDPA